MKYPEAVLERPVTTIRTSPTSEEILEEILEAAGLETLDCKNPYPQR